MMLTRFWLVNVIYLLALLMADLLQATRSWAVFIGWAAAVIAFSRQHQNGAPK